MKKFLKYVGAGLLLLIVTPLVVGQVLRLVATEVPPPGELYDVGGYKLHINCVEPKNGSNDLPTVIIEAGAGTPSPTYHWLQEGIAETTKACVYDRAGLAWSEESGLPRDSQTIATALHTLLDEAGIKRPFVFAGHSIAGLYTRQYIEQYPDDVAGLVFLDASHPNQVAAFGLDEDAMAEQADTLEEQLATVKLMINLGITEIYNPMTASAPDFAGLPESVQEQADYVSTLIRYFEAAPLEGGGFDVAAEQAARNTSLGNRPVVAISATQPIPPEQKPEGFPDDLVQIFANLHKEIAALSSNGRHVEIDTANHMSLVANKDQVAKVLPYIHDVVMEAAKQGNPANQS